MRETFLATNCIYHVYNRGTDKREIFLDPSYYSRFISILKHCLTYNYPYSLLMRFLKTAESKTQKQQVFQRLETKRTEPLVEIISFCLMPNHYHLTLKQLSDKGISNFMQRIGNAYTKYFNILQDRSGRLFEATFKAVPVESEEQLIHLSRYQHINPYSLDLTPKELVNYSWSSLPTYLGKKEPSFVNPEMVLSSFKDSKSYLDFVLAEIRGSETFHIQDIAIDDDFGWFAKLRTMEKERKEQLLNRYLKEITNT